MKSHISEPLYQQITKKTGLRREQIMINSSHTHTGPAVGLEEERLGFLKAPAHIKETSQYTRKLSDRLVALSIEATKHLSAARLSWGGGAPFVMNRREFTDRGIILGVHPRGLVDRSVPVLKIASADSKLRGVLLGTACHNTSLTHRDF